MLGSRRPRRKRQQRDPLLRDDIARQAPRYKREIPDFNYADDDLLGGIHEERRERTERKRRRREAVLQPKIPKVNKVNFEHFKNRYGVGKPAHVIDVLVGGQDLRPQVRIQASHFHLWQFLMPDWSILSRMTS